MAIIKNGKIHGRIGNYVYRVVNGVEIIQSYPRKIKVSDNTKIENERFSLCSSLSSRVYQVVKDFALNIVNPRLYSELTSLFRINLFSSRSIEGSAKYVDWNLIKKTEQLNMHIKQSAYSNEGILPALSIIGDRCVISTREFEAPSQVYKYLNNAEYMQTTVSLIHYDFDSGIAQPVYEYNTERQSVDDVLPARELLVDLDNLVPPVKSGLLLLCFGTCFFSYRESSAYLNSVSFNPFVIVGIWYKTEPGSQTGKLVSGS